jgi:predicted Ser/Thr protein kinase
MTLNGQTIGPYHIEREIGRGGMATVYLCRQAGEPRPVALKVLHPHMTQDSMLVRRFKLEGENGTRLRHPNIVSVYDAGHAGGYYYLAMEYVGGGTLADLLKGRKRPLSIDEALPILRQVAEGLDYAHGLGILHRDVKPGNFLLGEGGRVLLTDFGVARHLAADHTVVTVAGFAVGTPAYMSPEQARGDLELDRRSDVYSLGVVAYAVLTGQLPFDAPSQIVLLRKIIDDLPAMPETHQPDLPPGVGFALRKVLAKDPARRYATAGEFAAALDQGRRWRPTPLDLAAAEKAILAQPSTPSSRAARGETNLKPARPQRGRVWLAGLAAVVLLLLLAAAGFYYLAPQQAVDLVAQLRGEAQPPAANASPPALAQGGAPGIPPTATPTAAAGADGTGGVRPTATAAAMPTPEVVSILLAPYTDAEQHFVLNVPQGWRTTAAANGLRFSAPDLPVALFVYALAGEAVQEDAQTVLAAFAGSAPDLFPNLAGVERLNLDGDAAWPAIRFETHSGAQPPALVQMVRVGSGQHLFALGQQMEAQQAARYGALLPAVVGSFTVLPDPTPTPAPPTSTATASPTALPTATATTTAIPLPSPTPSPAPPLLPAATPTTRATPTVRATATPTPSRTPPNTPTITRTPTPQPSATPPPTPNAAATRTVEAQRIATSVAATLAAIPTATLTPSVTPTPDLNATLTAIAVELTQIAPTPTPDLNMTLTAIAVELTQIAPTPTPDLNTTLTAIAVELTSIATTPTPP